MYLTYDEYTLKGGQIDIPAFLHLENQAENILNDFCLEWKRHNIQNLDSEDGLWHTIKEFMFQAIEKINQANSDNVTSIRNLDVSVNLQTNSFNDVKSSLYDLFVACFPLEWVSVANEI